MTDRELLELAAKAAGLNVRFNPRFCGGMGAWERDVRPVEPPFSEWLLWNPLTDDGDALRLAGMLHINIQHNASLVDAGPGNVTAFPCGSPGLAQTEFSSFDLDDRMSSIRRAIVRAAAEIGRAMP